MAVPGDDVIDEGFDIDGRKDENFLRCDRHTIDWSKTTNVVKYVHGKHTDYDVPWSNVDAIYMPFNLSRMHWVLVCVDFQVRELIVFDSLIVLHLNADLEHEMRSLCKNFLGLLIASAVMESHNLLIDRWTLRRDAFVPQQDKSGDCGMFTCKFFEYDVTGSKMDTLTQDRMQYYRRQYAIQISANRTLF
ncbi:sentrin-specific protease [Benincasa hispida]|uniref:sentrin-specific protease n=1 Tax=Benincasa hispida TaxID=102211 RepID=UPI0019014C27|nr:sentrin-specific protease [Benincasa hispida]